VCNLQVFWCAAHNSSAVCARIPPLYVSEFFTPQNSCCVSYKYSGVCPTSLLVYAPEPIQCVPQVCWCMPQSPYSVSPQVCWCMPQSPYSVSHKSAGVCSRALTVWCHKSYRVFLGNHLVYVAELFLCMTQKSGACPRSLLKCVPEALNLHKSILCCNWEALPRYSICTFVCRNGFMQQQTSAWPQDKSPLFIIFCCCLFDHSTTPVHADSPFYG